VKQLRLGFSAAPEHVVLLSGGHASARVAEAVVRRYGRDSVVFLNHDIHPRVEDADVKRFKREVANRLGVPITYANHPEWDRMDQFDVVMEARAFKVQNGQELCTSRLKTEPFHRWLASFADPDATTIYYGFDATEEHRIRRRASILGAAGWRTDYPLALWPKSEVIASTHALGVEPPLTYSRRKHGNCEGCLKAGWQSWYRTYCERPDIWAKGKRAENVIGHTIHRDGPLEEREAEFAAMQSAGVEPTELVPPQTFWANARKAVRHLPVLEEEAPTPIPCECVFRKRGRPALPPCTCGALLRGEGHTLLCARVIGDDSTREAA
jgi:hypothetical protein